MLGQYALAAAKAEGYDIITFGRPQNDLNNIETIAPFIAQIKPSIVLHLAAQTDVDLCERDPALAARINVLATREVAKATTMVGGWLGYVSTSNVFGAKEQTVYNELDLPDPVNYYGRSKFWGEQMVIQYAPHNHLIVRAGWMIGGGASKDHKFVGKIIAQIRNGASQILAVDDKQGSITAAENLARFLLASAKRGRIGLFHFASKGTVTRFQIACEIAKSLGYSGVVRGVRSNIFPLSAPRATSEGIESIFLSDAAEDIYIGSWNEDLQKYISQF